MWGHVTPEKEWNPRILQCCHTYCWSWFSVNSLNSIRWPASCPVKNIFAIRKEDWPSPPGDLTPHNEEGKREIANGRRNLQFSGKQKITGVLKSLKFTFPVFFYCAQWSCGPRLFKCLLHVNTGLIVSYSRVRSNMHSELSRRWLQQRFDCFSI